MTDLYKGRRVRFRRFVREDRRGRCEYSGRDLTWNWSRARNRRRWRRGFELRWWRDISYYRFHREFLRGYSDSERCMKIRLSRHFPLRLKLPSEREREFQVLPVRLWFGSDQKRVSSFSVIFFFFCQLSFIKQAQSHDYKVLILQLEAH